MKTPRFTRQKEDFICAVCGARVAGNGYTNHCPQCLSSKHVDINPGDRASPCGGIMPAESLVRKNGADYIVQRCVRCGHARPNKVAPDDVFEAVMALSNGTMDAYRARLTKKG
ncbi:MAG: RNHCP domain-containing protein [Alphaproteobacteria bacterium]|nr:RNHCP domain-containing protein [Alphaproteobacteria bacterium]